MTGRPALLALAAALTLASAIPAPAQTGSRAGGMTAPEGGPGSRKEAIQAGAAQSLGQNRDAIAGAIQANAGQGQAVEVAQEVLDTYFPNQDPQAYAQCVVSNGSRQQLAVLAGAAQTGEYEAAAETVAAILQDPQTQACLHDAGLPPLTP